MLPGIIRWEIRRFVIVPVDVLNDLERPVNPLGAYIGDLFVLLGRRILAEKPGPGVSGRGNDLFFSHQLPRRNIAAILYL